MPKVKSYAIVEDILEWEGYVPDDVPENEIWWWIRQNVDGGEFTDTECSSWEWCQEVEIIEEDDPPAATE